MDKGKGILREVRKVISKGSEDGDGDPIEPYPPGTIPAAPSQVQYHSIVRTWGETFQVDPIMFNS